MTIKTKISLGLAFLFGVIVLLGGLGAFYLYRLSEESKTILKDNYISLEYVQHIRTVIDDGELTRQDWTEIEKNLALQHKNITELGEGETTQLLRQAFAPWKDTISPNPMPIRKAHLDEINPLLNRLMDLNMQSMIRKNAAVEEKAQQIRNYMILILTVCSLITFSFIVNFPGYIADPLHELTAAITEIANKNYSKRVHFQSKDEFGSLATSFNDMALRLEQYEHSNLARVIFEKRRIETIIDNLKDAILGLDERNRILFLNPVMEQLLGLTESAMLGKYAPDVALHNDLLRMLLTTDASVLPLKIFADNQESYFTKETLEVFLTGEEQSHSPKETENQAVTVGRVIVLKNITAFRERDLAKTNFIATISHELKTPISSIKMSLKLLNDQRVGELNAEQESLLMQIREDSERLLKITGELLNLSQAETGHIQLHLQQVAPSTIVDYALQAVQFQAEQKQVELIRQIPESLPLVHADSEKTGWVLINFLSNAIRFSPQGSQVAIRAQSVANAVRFSVQDAGQGIEPQYQNRIFERYFQIPGSYSSSSGTGLGLSISKEIIEAQNGQIGVESQPGEGSTFAFLLPVS